MDMDDVTEDIEAIDALLETFQHLVTTGNGAGLHRVFSEQAMVYFSGSKTAVCGRDAIVVTWQRHLLQWQNVVVVRRETQVRIHGDVAWAHFLWDGEGTAKDVRYRLEGERWTVVMMCEDGGWRFAQMHTSMPYDHWEAHRI